MVSIEYGLVILVGMYVTVRGIFRFRQKKGNKEALIDDPRSSRSRSAEPQRNKLIRDVSTDGNSAVTL